MENFGYIQAENARVLDRTAEGARRELREVLMILRNRYGRRRLFRTADVEAVVREVVRAGAHDLFPPTPPKFEEKKK